MQSNKSTRAARSAAGGEQMRKPVVVLLKAVTLGLLATTVLLLLFSFLFCRQDLPFTLLNPLSSFGLIVGSFTAGYLAARSLGQRGMLLGCVCGGVIFLILLIASLQVKPQLDQTALFKLAIALLGGSIGGITGVNRKRTSHHNKPKHKEKDKKNSL